MSRGNKSGGRQRGTPNRITGELRTVIMDIIQQEFDSLTDYLNQLQPKERLEILIKLLPYAMPKIMPMLQEQGQQEEQIIYTTLNI